MENSKQKTWPGSEPGFDQSRATQQQHNIYIWMLYLYNITYTIENLLQYTCKHFWSSVHAHIAFFLYRFCSYFIPFISIQKRKGKQYQNTVQNEEGSQNRTYGFNVHHTNRISSITRLKINHVYKFVYRRGRKVSNNYWQAQQHFFALFVVLL